MLNDTIIPIAKNKKKSLNESSNYRGIALSSIIGKILDLVILDTHRDVLESSSRQFSFKPKHSTTMCSFAIEETVQYYLNNNSNVYIMMLDASKAFDRVNYIKMFKLLINKALCPLVCRLLVMMYTKQSLCIKWGMSKSKFFHVTNGVKQGGVLSPVLFTSYMDKLLEELESSGVGCYVGTKFMGAFGYADDGAVLAPTVTSLKIMLNICDEFGKQYHVLFNPDKYQLLFYSNNDKTLHGIW